MASRAAQLAQELSDLLSKTGRRFVIAYESTLPEVQPGEFRLWNSDCDDSVDAEKLHNLVLNTEDALFETQDSMT